MFKNKQVSEYDKKLIEYRSKKFHSPKGKIKAYVKLIPQICESIIGLLETGVLMVAEIE